LPAVKIFDMSSVVIEDANPQKNTFLENCAHYNPKNIQDGVCQGRPAVLYFLNEKSGRKG